MASKKLNGTKVNTDIYDKYLDRLRKAGSPEEYVDILENLDITYIQKGHLTRRIVDEGLFSREQIKEATRKQYAGRKYVRALNNLAVSERYHKAREKAEKHVKRKGVRWSPSEFMQVYKNQTLVDYKLAEKLGRSLSSVSTKKRAALLVKLILQKTGQRETEKNILPLIRKDIITLTEEARNLGIEFNQKGVKRFK